MAFPFGMLPSALWWAFVSLCQRSYSSKNYSHTQRTVLSVSRHPLWRNQVAQLTTTTTTTTLARMIGTDRTGADREGCQDGAVPVVAFKSPFLDSAETTNQDRHGWQQQQEERHETGDNRPRQLPGCVLIILNSRIRVPIGPVFSKLWSMSSYRICADGGANRLFDAAAAAIANTNGGGDATYDISSSLKVSAESTQP